MIPEWYTYLNKLDHIRQFTPMNGAHGVGSILSLSNLALYKLPISKHLLHQASQQIQQTTQAFARPGTLLHSEAPNHEPKRKGTKGPIANLKQGWDLGIRMIH